ncbi:hypothetical protein N7447_004311 [Penicillium robsamsonii]|uniref:uncharacterized protein n=1 Tax=Penicillium robsamsonii TaxID=1792511 RepID=UPI002548C935|nr:uncharacterized protein N7447_004311 [Penicillium robsamsonii]KAJ5827548.1 hypothetical protein N7447_004311 [Penicillium robsamsonii]
MSRLYQPTELIYCAGSVCIPNRKHEYLRRRRCDLNKTEDIDHNARAQGPQLFAVSVSLVLPPEHITSLIYKLMSDSEPLTSHQGPKETASR